MASIMLTVIVLVPGSVFAQSEQQAENETLIEGLRLLPHQVQGVDIGYVEKDTTPAGGKYFCGSMSEAGTAVAAAAVDVALSSLPYNTADNVKLKYIILCSNVKAKGQRIGGIPVPPLNLLMLNVDGLANNNDEDLQRLVLHELFHFTEYRFNTFRDHKWSKLFGGGYINSYNGLMRQSLIGSGKKGFINDYSMTFPHEERAELFRWLILNPSELAGYININNDEVLRRKAEYIIQKCNDYLGMSISSDILKNKRIRVD